VRIWVRALVAVAAATGLAGCSDIPDTPRPPSQGLAPGPASGPETFFGVEMRPCTRLELDGYPKNLARPSTAYYEGPWCARVDTARVYLWAYARDLRFGADPAAVTTSVTLDAEQMFLDLVAQGYARVCGEVVDGQSVDVGLEQRGESRLIRLTAAGVLGSQTGPLSLAVTSSPSLNYPEVLEGAPAPPCIAGLPVTVTSPTSAQTQSGAQ